MTVALFDTQDIKNIADAIRSVNNETEEMTIGDMPTKISNMVMKDYKEVWLHAAQDQNTLSIDTGIAGDPNHTFQVIGYGNIYSTTTLVAAKTASTNRQGINLLTTQNGFRMVWGDSGLKQFTYQTTELSAWRPMAITLNKLGMQIKGFTQSYSAVTKNEVFDSVPTGGSTANYEIFTNIGVSSGTTNTTSQPGVFRRLKIYDDTNTLIHNLVPIMKSDFSLALLDKVTNTEIAVPTGETGFAGIWNPNLDYTVNQKLLTTDDAL